MPNDQGTTVSAPSETFEELKAEVIQEAQTEVPRKRGRPKGSKNRPREEAGSAPLPEPILPDVIAPEFVCDMVSLCFDLIAKRRGSHWKLDQTEKENIGKLTTKVVNKHAPEWLRLWGDEISLGFVLGAVVLSRLSIDKQIQAQIEESKRQQPQAAEV